MSLRRTTIFISLAPVFLLNTIQAEESQVQSQSNVNAVCSATFVTSWCQGLNRIERWKYHCVNKDTNESWDVERDRDKGKEFSCIYNR